MISIPEVNGHPVDPVAAYAELLAAFLTSHPNQPLLTKGSGEVRKGGDTLHSGQWLQDNVRCS